MDALCWPTGLLHGHYITSSTSQKPSPLSQLFCLRFALSFSLFLSPALSVSQKGLLERLHVSFYVRISFSLFQFQKCVDMCVRVLERRSPWFHSSVQTSVNLWRSSLAIWPKWEYDLRTWRKSWWGETCTPVTLSLWFLCNLVETLSWTWSVQADKKFCKIIFFIYIFTRVQKFEGRTILFDIN